ncbi:MAG: hypothetical protein M2R45_02259 [Verrucomicrobia subdivision 3 bacterium]|nr:hypothetical protein [Limisphaerales bacterium]MCS1413955.1 hypothetical protein [Limisphaerales bacterium]
METRLFVGNLSFKITESDLLDVFLPYGDVIEVRIILDRDTARPRGFGFVTMASKEEANKAIEALNGQNIEGRPLTVNIARPREERPRHSR